MGSGVFCVRVEHLLSCRGGCVQEWVGVALPLG